MEPLGRHNKPGTVLMLECRGGVMQERAIERIIILLPSSPGERFVEDGLRNAAEEWGLFFIYASFDKCSSEEARKYCERLLTRENLLCVVYPEFGSDVFDWYGAERDWFFSRKNGTPIHESSTDPDMVGGYRFLQMLAESGNLPLIPMPMHYGGPFDFEITFYGRPETFIIEILEKFFER